MHISADTLLLLFLTAAVVGLVAWNVRLSTRLDRLNRDCVQVMTATNFVLEKMQAFSTDQTLDLRLAIGEVRDRILEKLNQLTR